MTMDVDMVREVLEVELVFGYFFAGIKGVSYSPGHRHLLLTQAFVFCLLLTFQYKQYYENTFESSR